MPPASSSKTDPVFPPGFERDTKALLMLREYGVVTRAEVRRNVEKLGVELIPESDLAPPPLRPLETVGLNWDEDDENNENEE